MTHEFDDAISVGEDGGVTFPERWTMGPGFAHGGYLMSVALAGARGMVDHPDPLSVSSHFVRPGRVGPARVDRSVVKSGRTHATVRSDIVQDGTIAVASLITFGDLTGSEATHHRTATMPAMPPPSECAPADTSDPMVPRMVDNLDLRLTPMSLGFALGIALEEARMEGWVSFADGRPIDVLSLPMFADALPPPILNLGMNPGWTPTLEMSLHVRRRPATSRLAVSFHASLVAGAYFESSGTLWTDDGELVAMSRQLQLLRNADASASDAPTEPAVR